MLKRTIFALSMLVSGAAHAAVLDWTAVLSPANEVPPVVGSSGTGTASGTIDTISNLLSWEILFSGLTGPATGLHFHQAPAGSNGSVVVNVGVLSGLTSPTAGSVTISEAQETELLAGNWYINIHTATNPGGEIRGQVAVAPVPVPGTAGLALAGLGALLVLRRRRNRG